MKNIQTRRTLRNILILTIAVVFLISLPSVATAKKTLRISAGNIPFTLDPLLDSGALVVGIYQEMYDPLFNADDKGNIIPALALSWDFVDKTTCIIKLRKGVNFHNGEPFTAESVAFTLNRVLNPAEKTRWEGRIQNAKSVEAVDPYTVKIVTKVPFPTLIQGLTTIRILPVKYYKEKGKDYFATNPVGTGPFKFRSYKRGEYLHLTANMEYWGKKPKIDEIIFREQPEASTRLAAIETNEADIAFPIHPDYVERLESKGIKVKSTSLGYTALIFLAQRGATANHKLRVAMQYAVDKDSIFKNVIRGFGKVASGQITGPDGFGYNPDIKAYPYDPEKAKALLRESGYKGEEIIFNYPEGRFLKGKEIVTVVAGYLTAVGVNVKIQALEAGDYFTRHRDAILGPMFIMGWQYLPAMDAHLAYSAFRSDDPRKHMSLKEFDELFDKESAEFDLEKRRALLQKMAVVWKDHAPTIVLFQLPEIFAVQKKVKVFNPSPHYYYRLNEVEMSE